MHEVWGTGGLVAPGSRVLNSKTRRSLNRASALMRTAAIYAGKTQTALGALYRRLAAQVGKAKAVTATARKLAVMFYNAVRFGVKYVDPGHTYYEERYCRRVLHHLSRRASEFGYSLVEDGAAQSRVS